MCVCARAHVCVRVCVSVCERERKRGRGRERERGGNNYLYSWVMEWWDRDVHAYCDDPVLNKGFQTWSRGITESNTWKIATISLISYM